MVGCWWVMAGSVMDCDWVLFWLNGVTTPPLREYYFMVFRFFFKASKSSKRDDNNNFSSKTMAAQSGARGRTRGS